MKLSKAQKLLALSALGIFRGVNQIPHLSQKDHPELVKRDYEVGKWFEKYTGAAADEFTVVAADLFMVNKTIIELAEHIIEMEEPEGGDDVEIVPADPKSVH